MFLASDNGGPVHPAVMEHVIAANQGYAMPYGADVHMDKVRNSIREIFEAPDAAVYLVATGTAANALALACYTKPWHAVFCTRVAHVEQDECGAPEFFSAGAKLSLIESADKMSPEGLSEAIARHTKGVVHGVQPGPVSITQVTECGSVYSLAELAALTEVAKQHDLPVHLDGARFANAQVALGCSAAEMTWKAGVDVVSFGGTKNGCMGVEAVVFFDPERAWEFELRRKRGAHLFSKHRYLSAQMVGYLRDSVYLDIARAANENAAFLAEGLRAKGAEFLHEPQANMIFTRFPRRTHQALHAAGAKYYAMGDVNQGDPDALVDARLVCDWSISRDALTEFLSHF